MNIVTIGRGSIGNGLATLWTAAGHNVTMLGRDLGGDASNADVLLVAVPGTAIADVLGKGRRAHRQDRVDATGIYAERTGRFASLSEEVQSFTHGPVAKSFNLNYASLLNQVAAQRVRPSSLYAADDDARGIPKGSSPMPGYDPVFVGGIDRAEPWRSSAGSSSQRRATPPFSTGSQSPVTSKDSRGEALKGNSMERRQLIDRIARLSPCRSWESSSTCAAKFRSSSSTASGVLHERHPLVAVAVRRVERHVLNTLHVDTQVLAKLAVYVEPDGPASTR